MNAEKNDNNNDIEDENNEDIKSEFPFDPNKISIHIIPYTIGQLVDKLEYNEIIVPPFQRLPNLWKKKEKSRFIESLMLKLPIPLFYFAETDDNKWLVIDGLQRISTLEHFIVYATVAKETKEFKNNALILENLEFRTELNNHSWNDLPKDIQRRINTSQITINLIGKTTPDQVKYNIFSRINQSGIQLKPQEIRTALFQGFRCDFITNLVSEAEQGRSFKIATDYSISSTRQEDLDFATRFVSFYLLGYKEYEPDMDAFMTKGTKAIPEHITEQKDIIDRFIKAMALATEVFEKNAFRKPQEGNRRKAINKPLFEVISVNFAKLSNDERINIKKNKTAFLAKYYTLQKNARFFDAITSGTAAKDRVKERHEAFENLISEFK